MGDQYIMKYTARNFIFCVSHLWKVMFICVVVVVAAITVSLLTKKPDYGKLDQLVVKWIDVAPFYFFIFNKDVKDREVESEDFGLENELTEY